MDQKTNDIIGYARAIISHEAEAINSVVSAIDDNFKNAVNAILSVPDSGRVIVSGVGKTSFIGMKISATLASTGTPSFFLHPAEATHGDLGRYSKDDLVIILSNSGETSEILKIIPAIKRVGCPIISITATKESSLARHSEYPICIGQFEEAGPLGLAPTTSTTAMLAIGDALAMTVLNQRGLTREEFAFYHPGGALGRKLMTVSEIMRQGEECAVANQSMYTKDVIHLITITKGRPGAAAIVDDGDILVGVFTDGDLRRCLESGSEFLTQPVSTFMGKNPKTCGPQQLVEEALRIMSQHKIDQIIVVDEGRKPLGTIDIQDIISIT